MGLENSHCNRLIFSTSCHKRPAHYSSGTLVFLDKVLSFRAFFSVFRGEKLSVSQFFRDLHIFSHFFPQKLSFWKKFSVLGQNSHFFANSQFCLKRTKNKPAL